jgi:ribonuclease HII
MVAGVDEAGRGPLAGPVVAAAVVLPFEIDLSGIDDSKALSNKARPALYNYIVRVAATALGIIEPSVIDQINILEASRLAMVTAVEKLPLLPDYLLIDGPMRLDVAIDQRGIIGGDRLSVSVAAASIVAKVTRDSIMQELHGRFPQYGFDRNKGYPTQDHRKAIVEFGPSLVHRKTFRGVKEFVT